MASSNFLPAREADLVTWSINFDTKITATPTDYGLTALQATAYAAVHDAFVTAYNVANDPTTRSPVNITAKNTAKAALIDEARELARIVQATPAGRRKGVILHFHTIKNDPFFSSSFSHNQE